MPTYEYRCPEGHEFERFQRMSDEPKAECPECGQAAQRLLSAGGGLIFKGSGFYITDYRSESYRKEAKKAESGSASGEGKKASGAGEATGGSTKKADAGSGSAASSGGTSSTSEKA